MSTNGTIFTIGKNYERTLYFGRSIEKPERTETPECTCDYRTYFGDTGYHFMKYKRTIMVKNSSFDKRLCTSRFEKKNHSIISPLCLVWVRAPLWPHVRQAKFCLRVCQVFFLGVLPFSPHLLIGPSHMS